MIGPVIVWIAMFAVASPPDGRQSRVVRAFDLTDATGEKHSAKEWGKAKAIVLFYVWTECPASNGYAPEMTRLVKDFSAKGVVFYGVHSDPETTAEQAVRHAKEYELAFPMLLDPTQQLARTTGTKRVPSVAVLAPDGNVIYSGRIDDRYVSLGKKRDEPMRRDTQEVLNALLAGKHPTIVESEVIGCLLPRIIEKPKR